MRDELAGDQYGTVRASVCLKAETGFVRLCGNSSRRVQLEVMAVHDCQVECDYR